MSRMTHTHPAALAAEAAMRRPHHRHPTPPEAHVHKLIDLIQRLSAWLTHPSLGGLVRSLVHYLELAVIFCALAVGLVVMGRLVGVALRRRAAAAAAYFRLVLPENFERQGLVGFFRTLTSLLRPHLVGAAASVSFTLWTEGEQLEIELCCSHGIAPQVRAALAVAVEGISIEPTRSNRVPEAARAFGAVCVAAARLALAAARDAPWSRPGARDPRRPQGSV